jgi:hypothetical protein
LTELQNYAAYYLSARADALKLQARSIAIYAVLGLLAALAGAAGLITAVVLTLDGMANGLGYLMGGRIWAGQLVTGLGILVVAAATVVIAMRYLTNSSRKRTMAKYEHWRNDQRAQFGHDVFRRAAQHQRRT